VVCHGSGALPSVVLIRLTTPQRVETEAQYQEDTHLLGELQLAMAPDGVQGPAEGLRELAYLIECDYHRESGFQTVPAQLKRQMREAALRIQQAVGRRGE